MTECHHCTQNVQNGENAILDPIFNSQIPLATACLILHQQDFILKTSNLPFEQLFKISLLPYMLYPLDIIQLRADM